MGSACKKVHVLPFSSPFLLPTIFSALSSSTFPLPVQSLTSFLPVQNFRHLASRFKSPAACSPLLTDEGQALLTAELPVLTFFLTRTGHPPGSTDVFNAAGHDIVQHKYRKNNRTALIALGTERMPLKSYAVAQKKKTSVKEKREKRTFFKTS